MNVWIFNHYAQPADVPGGTRHYDMAKQLVRRGHEVTVFASSFHHPSHTEVRLSTGEKVRVEEHEGVAFVWLKTHAYKANDWHRALGMLQYMLRASYRGCWLRGGLAHIRAPDVVLGVTVHPLAVLAAWVSARRYRAGFSMEIGDLWPQALVDLGQISAQHPLVGALRTLDRFLCRQAVRIIVLGSQMVQHVTQQVGSPDKAVWIPNGVDLTLYEEALPRRSQSGAFAVTYVGAHGTANALSVVLEAAEAIQSQGVQGIRIVLIGDGPEKPKLIKLSREMGLRNVEFRPPVSKLGVPGVLRQAGALIVAVEPGFLSYGGSLNKLSDYMASGRPVVFSGGAQDNPIECARCGLVVEAQDPQALAEAIIRLFEMSDEERDAMGERGRAYVEAHYDVAKLALRLESVLKEASQLGGRHRP
jgi:glycosyltransferase involved in cell wall biosynthesis